MLLVIIMDHGMVWLQGMFFVCCFSKFFQAYCKNMCYISKFISMCVNKVFEYAYRDRHIGSILELIEDLDIFWWEKGCINLS